MLPNYLFGVTWFSILLLVGLVCSIIALRIRVPDVLLFLIAGIVAGLYIEFPYYSFLGGLGVVALVVILFDSTSKFKISEIRKVSPDALKLSVVFLVFTLIGMSIFTHLFFSDNLFNLEFLLFSAVFAALICGTSAEAVLSVFKDKKGKIAEILEFESILNTPLAVLIPIIIVGILVGGFGTELIAKKLFQAIMTGVGAGLVMGIVIFEIMMRKYLGDISSLTVIATALFTYVLAEIVGGNGVLAVTTLGLVFGKYQVKEKYEIQRFIDVFAVFLKIVIFILLGLMIKIPGDKVFLIKSVLLFGVYVYIRYLAVNVTFLSSKFTKKEKWFMTLNVSKGVAVAVVAFMLMSYSFNGLEYVVDLAVLFIFYSILTASVAMRFSDYFLEKEIMK